MGVVWPQADVKLFMSIKPLTKVMGLGPQLTQDFTPLHKPIFQARGTYVMTHNMRHRVRRYKLFLWFVKEKFACDFNSLVQSHALYFYALWKTIFKAGREGGIKHHENAVVGRCADQTPVSLP